MTIQQLLTLARDSELHKVGYKNDDAVVLGFMNLGLIELYKRFPLQVDEAIITIDGTRQYYKMDGTDAAVSMPTNSYYMWIISAYAEVPDDSDVKTLQLPVNDEDTNYSVNTVNWNTLQIPIALDGEVISIIYASGPDTYMVGSSVVSGAKYVVSSLGSSTLAQWQALFSGLTAIPTIGDEITATATGSLDGGAMVYKNATLPIPLQLTEALLHYIGYRAHGAMNGSIEAETNTHYQRFEASCQRAVAQGMYTSDSLEMHRDMKGFV